MRISDWSSDVCSSDLDPVFVGTHYARALADRAGRIIAKCGRLVRELPRRRVEIEPARLHDIACYAQFFRRGEQIAAALLMEPRVVWRSEEHTSELQSLMRISYDVFCLKKKKTTYVTSLIRTSPTPSHT